MREAAPGLCKWLEFIYPTNVATHVLSWARHSFRSQGPARLSADRRLSCSGETHGARKFGSCGSSGGFPDTASPHPLSPLPIILDIAPTCADDGVTAGDEPEVLRAIQHMKRVMPLLGLRFSMMQVVAAAAGPQDPERCRAFRDEGCTPALDGFF